MTLASILATDETAVICDLAETYGVLNYRALPVKTLAALCAGLRENSRIKMKLAGVKAETELTFLAWAKTKDGEKNVNRPKSIVDVLNGTVKDSDVMAFDTAEEFEAARAAIIGGDG